MIKNKIICLPIETKVREFDGKLLLTSHLLNEGYSVLIGSKGGIIRESYNLSNATIILKSLDPSVVYYYKMMQKRNNTLIAYDVEGGVFYEDESIDIQFRYHESTVKYLRSIFLFGSKIKKVIESVTPYIDIRQVVVAGDSRFDLLKPKYDLFFKKNIDSLKKTYGEFFLINTSFSSGNPFVGVEELRKYVYSSQEFNDASRTRFDDRVLVDTKVINYFIDAVKAMATNFPDTNFIVRPHPSEKIDIYNDSFIKHNNIFVTNEGNVHSWIKASIGVLHYDCTTGIEAVLAGKPTISYVPLKLPGCFAWLPSYISELTENVDDLNDKVARIITKKIPVELRDDQTKTLSQYISNVNLFSHTIIVDTINKILNNTLESKYDFSLIQFIKKQRSNLSAIKRFIYKNKSHTVQSWKISSIKSDEIFEKIELLKGIESHHYNYRIHKKGSNTFLIQPN